MEKIDILFRTVLTVQLIVCYAFARDKRFNIIERILFGLGGLSAIYGWWISRY